MFSNAFCIGILKTRYCVIKGKLFTTNFQILTTLSKKAKEYMLVTMIFSFSHNAFYYIKDRNSRSSNIQFDVFKCRKKCYRLVKS